MHQAIQVITTYSEYHKSISWMYYNYKTRITIFVTVVFIPSKLGFVWPNSFIMHGCKKFLVSSIQSVTTETGYIADNNKNA